MERKKAPWHLWTVAVLSLVWHAGGVFDYIMSKTRNEAYLAQMSPEQLSFLDSFPTWVTAFWAVAIWFAVLGSLLLLLRRKLAAPVFAISFVAMVVVTIHNMFIAEPSALTMMDPAAMWFTAAIFVVSILLIIYSSTQATLHRLI